jgi:hypothetical protein
MNDSGRRHRLVMPGLLPLLGLLLGGSTAAAAITLAPTAIGFNNPISVDFHQPTSRVILSTNWPGGQPYNTLGKAGCPCGPVHCAGRPLSGDMGSKAKRTPRL